MCMFTRNPSPPCLLLFVTLWYSGSQTMLRQYSRSCECVSSSKERGALNIGGYKARILGRSLERSGDTMFILEDKECELNL